MPSKKKVLVVTGTPFRDDTNNGKTLRALFSNFAPEELAQIYFAPSVPNVADCETYYRVYEKQLVKSAFGLFSKKCGGVVSCDLENKKPERYDNKLVLSKGKIFMRLLREFLWDISHWNNRHLKAWLDQVHPTVIFAFLPRSKRSAKFFSWVAKRYHCKLVMLVTDDHYHDSETTPSVLRGGFYKRLQKANDKAAKYSEIILGCSELTAKEYGELFNLPSEAVFTPSAKRFLDMPFREQEASPVVFRYFGNIGLERWKVLKALGEAIRDYNGAECKAKLEVYSGFDDKTIIDALTIPGACEFKGFVYGDEFYDLLESADVAVHVESFSPEMMRKTRLSVSTKIADYLGAGKCILAIGAENLASIMHVVPAAYAVNNLSELPEAVAQLVSNHDLRNDLQQKARALAEQEHNAEKIGIRMREILLGE